jgi:type II secretory pathway component GspD/PulD (secretin)
MKKTLIALALMSMAGTAAANNIQVRADVFSGKEHVKTITAVVEAGKPVEINDKDVLAHFGSAPSSSAVASAPSVENQAEETAQEPGFILKMTPRVLSDGRILVDAAYSLTTLKTEKILRDGVEKEEPVTHIKSMSTQVLVGKDPGTLPDEFSPRAGDLIVTFSAKEIQ